ncbi:MAG: hypothetical protein ACJ77R_04745 [Gemmatimonadaceae bacterium]
MAEQQQELVSSRSGERVAFNDDIFRKANEAIRTRAERLAPEDFEQLPFICECAQETCTEVVQIPTEEYERIRSNPRLFFNAPGHDVAAHGWAAVIERHEGYVVVEKLGRAGEIVEMLDDGS